MTPPSSNRQFSPDPGFDGIQEKEEEEEEEEEDEMISMNPRIKMPTKW